MSADDNDDSETKRLMWELLRSYEEKCGKAAGPLDAELIRSGYRWMNKKLGVTLRPSYVSMERTLS